MARTLPRQYLAVVGGSLVAVAFSGMAVCGRIAAGYGVPPFFAMAIRASFGVAITAAQLAMLHNAQRRADFQLARASWRLLLLRGPCSLAGGAGAFYAYSTHTLALGDIAALYQTVPLWTMLLGYLCFGATLRRAQGVATALAFAGAILIARPAAVFGSADDAAGAGVADEDASKLATSLVVLAAAVGAGAGFTVVQAINSGGVGATVQVFCNMLFQAAAGFLVAAALGQCTLPADMPPAAWAALLGIGVSGTIGQLGTVLVVRLDSATTFAITQQLDVALNFLWDVVLFSQRVGAFSIAGATLVCSGVLFLTVSRREDAGEKKRVEHAAAVGMLPMDSTRSLEEECVDEDGTEATRL